MSLTFNARLVVAGSLLLAIAACSGANGTELTPGGGHANPGVGSRPGEGDGGADAPRTASSGAAGSGSGSSHPGSSGAGGDKTDAGPTSQRASDGGNTTVASGADAACTASARIGQQQGFDVYMMLDYSGSMQMDGKWTGITSAIDAFVAEPPSGISVGLQYFGLPDPDAGTGTFGGLTTDSCDPALYAKPEIEISPLPAIGAQVMQSLSAHTMPNTSTPTAPALQGAIDHATAWAKAHPADATIVVLATDGDPTECGMTQNATQAQLLSEVESIAAAGVAATPRIPTFVIGVGTDTQNLDGIANAGATNSAFVVDTTMDISTQVLAALNRMRIAALGCQYIVSGTTNLAAINVQFTDGSGNARILPQVADKGHCPPSGDGWFYDNPSSPTLVLLCDATCGTVAKGGEVDLLIGCPTMVLPAR